MYIGDELLNISRLLTYVYGAHVSSYLECSAPILGAQNDSVS